MGGIDVVYPERVRCVRDGGSAVIDCLNWLSTVRWVIEWGRALIDLLKLVRKVRNIMEGGSESLC